MTFRALTVYGVQAELSPGTGLRPRARCGEGLASRAPHRCGAWMFWRRAVQGAVGTSKRIRPRVRGTTQSFRTHVVIAPSNWTAGGGAGGREAGPRGGRAGRLRSAELPAPARTCAPGGQRPPVISATVPLHRGEAQAGAVCTCPRFEMEPRGCLTGESARDFLKKRKQKPDTLRGQKGRGSSEPSLEMATADPSTLKLTPQEMQDL